MTTINQPVEQGCCFHKHGYLKIFMAVALVTLTAFLLLEARIVFKKYDYLGKADLPINMISINGQGKVSVAPDIATINVGLTTSKKTVAEAQSENNNKMKEITTAIKAIGIEDKDLKTMAYQINPQYDWTGGGSGVIIGYSVEQSLQVKVRNLDKINEVLAKAGELGANQIGQLVFEVDNPEKVKTEARAKAIANAQEKANSLSQTLGVKLGRITSFYESEGGSGLYPNYRDFALDASAKSVTMPAPQVQTGENEVIVDVTVSYELL